MSNKDKLKISEEAKNFLESEHLLFIDGEWSNHLREKIIVFDPATEEKIAEVQSGTTKDIDLAVNAAREALSGEWAKIPSHDRAQILHRLSDEIEANFSVLSELEVLDNGSFGACSILNRKPWRDSFKILCELGTKIHGKTIPVSPGGAMNGESLTYTKRSLLVLLAQLFRGIHL